MKKIFKKISILICNVVILSAVIGSSTTISNADIFKGGFSTKINPPLKCKTLYYYVEGPLQNYTPITQWSGVSSKLKLVKATKKNNADIVISYLKLSHNKKAGTVVPYYKGKKVDINSTWDKAYVYVYKHPFNVSTPGYKNYYHSSHKYETLAHEMGHALGLAHNTKSGVDTIMYSGAKSLGFTPFQITKYDKSELQRKWGK